MAACSAATQCHRPAATTRLQCATDRVRSCGHPLEDDRMVPVFGILTDETATEVTVIADLAANHRGALERIETESPLRLST